MIGWCVLLPDPANLIQTNGKQPFIADSVAKEIITSAQPITMCDKSETEIETETEIEIETETELPLHE